MARGFTRRLGRRGAVLLILGAVDIVYSGWLAHPGSARSLPALRWLADLLPLWMWAGMWCAVGLLCLWCAPRSRDAAAFAAAMFVKVLWAVLMLAAWVVGGADRGWVGALIWLLVAGLVAVISTWPEPAGGVA